MDPESIADRAYLFAADDPNRNALSIVLDAKRMLRAAIAEAAASGRPFSAAEEQIMKDRMMSRLIALSAGATPNPDAARS